jgi:hypothetical protein
MDVLRRSGKWMASRPYHVLNALFGLCVVAFLVAIPLPRKVPGMLFHSDGTYYFMYTHSLVIDHDLDFRDEYARLLPGSLPATTPTGLPANQFAVGPGLLWIPFFAVAHVLALALRGLGAAVATDGYGYPYQVAICLGSMTYGFAGIVLMYRLVARYFAATALAATVLVWFGTNIIYYMVAEPSMSHMVSLFAVALFLFLWLRWRPIYTARHWFMLGLAGGLVAIVRQPDATWLVLPVLDRVLARQPSSLTQAVPDGIRYVAGFALVFSLQMLTWKILYGNPLSSGYFYGGAQGFSWSAPRVFDMLLSLWRGIYPLHPLTLFATLGLAWFYRADKRLAVLLGVGFVAQVYLISSWGTQGGSFGGRMFIASLPALALGVAALLDWALARRAGPVVWAIGAVLVVWNGLFMVQYRFGYVPMGDSRYTLRQLTIGKVEMLGDLAHRLVGLFLR